jgi:hypothetical protein
MEKKYCYCCGDEFKNYALINKLNEDLGYLISLAENKPEIWEIVKFQNEDIVKELLQHLNNAQNGK